MDPQEDVTDRNITLSVQLPGDQEATATVHGSKPVMDVLVVLCAQHRLIPSDHVIKLISTNQNHIGFKPNSPIGSLDFEKVVLQAKGSDDANRKKPHTPVPTVRLLINYKKSHKAVVRVNPKVPLAELMLSVCEKCEFNPDTTILLRTCRSEERLDLNKTLNEYGIRELYAKDIKGGDEEQKTSVKEKNQRKKGNKGFFGLFKKSKKTSEQVLSVSAPGSPELNSRHAVRQTCLNGHSTSPAASTDMTKKRRAPRPPLMTSQSVAFAELSERNTSGKQGLLSRISSTESSLKRTKQRAPPPPSDGPSPSDADNDEDVEDDDDSSDKNRAHIAGRCPAIAEVMSELMESLQARRQHRILSSETPLVSHHQDSPGGSSEAEFQAPPGCRLLRNFCERDGLSTFTVVPQRCQQGRRCFEVSQQTSDAAKTEQELSLGAQEHPETQPVEDQTELFRSDGNASEKPENLPEIRQHFERENQTWTASKIEQIHNEQSIHLKNIKRDLESFQTGLKTLKPLGSKNNPRNAELRDTLASGSMDSKEKREYALVETSKEKNWIEEYKERRRKFLGGDDDDDDDGKIKREFRMEVDDNFPSPPPPVCWSENNSDGENMSEQMETATDARTRNRWPNNSNSIYEHYSDLSKPKAHSNQTSPELEPADHSSVPEHPSKSHSCSPEGTSLFALAVFQKAKHCRLGMDPKHSKR